MSSHPITRFAPSPTGFLHIGGARTALFNWLYARGRGGKMLLRIEDTDRQRSTDAAIAAILDGLSWLGLDWDGEPISQFARMERHAEVAWQLVESGHAYRCYASQEELAEMRETARAEGRPPRYDGRWRDRDPSEAPEGIKPVIRIKAPQDGETVVEDHVQGRVTFPNRDLDDFIILRSDGTPTYMLAVVVDDHDMGVTHVIRGDDHLTNAARQGIIYEALGWQVPQWAHIPLIHGPDGAKLSKRHGALGVEAYRAMGYLPEALRNYLARLGWGHGDEEIFSSEQATEWFDLDAIGKGAARFDFVKLQNLNGHYIRQADDARLVADMLKILPEMETPPAFPAELSAAQRTQLMQLMPGLKERAKTLVELVHNATFLFAARPLTLDSNAEGLLDEDARRRLGLLRDALGNCAWETEPLEGAVRTLAESEGIKLGKLAQPLRAALTGSTSSPGIFDVMLALGREETLARIADQASVA
ncbi:glutamyl-tRNA synthetase [Rhodopseudomonas julia]|uniref:Glutamate--tRNA ligase n=1 Tax=Rhodopseudomonas julia TaxID=200617 RepID=A0ABU0CAS4_9BRAD|nr:glutamate--tRNA ligase [Rhodopseudomonas julia]MDQ0327302.1 glutamyl-tRNA synthetase [Rhodopseudomonas julia]